MVKFCTNCGKEVNEANGFCASCGTSLQVKNQSIGKGVASTIIGILGLLYAIFGLTVYQEIVLEAVVENNAEAFGFALGYNIVQLIAATIAFFLANSERKNFKNVWNNIGFWSAIATFIICTIVFILVFTSLI